MRPRDKAPLSENPPKIFFEACNLAQKRVPPCRVPSRSKWLAYAALRTLRASLVL